MKLVYAAVLAHANAQTSWVCVYPVSVRSTKFRDLVGSFINVLPYVLDLQKSTAIQAINAEKERINHLKKHKYCPTSKVISQLITNNVDINIESIFQTVVADADCRIQPLILDSSIPTKNWQTPNIGLAKLLMEYQEINQKLYFNLNYLSGSFPDDHINKIAANIAKVAREIMEKPEQKLNEIELTEKFPKSLELLTLKQLEFYQQRDLSIMSSSRENTSS